VSEDARHALRSLAIMAGLTVGSYYLLRAMPALDLRLIAVRERARQRLETMRAWQRAKAEVLFEAYYATREAAQ